MSDFQEIRNQAIGTVEFVSPREIKILLDLNAPQNTALNTGSPQLFPKVNGFVLIPNEAGALVCIISWVGVEYSQFPKRKGYKDFDVIDLPFPLRKLSVSALGNIKEKNGEYEIDRGVFSFPSVGDICVIPDRKQLQAIVQNKDKNAKVKIGKSPTAANAPVYVNPDKVFGRHIAVLGNTGSGKSCSVAGLIRWSLEAAQKELDEGEEPNSRFIVLDPNGEYSKTFDDLNDSVKKFQVKIDDSSELNQLKVPAWMWNSFEWSSISQATQRTQRPILRRALKEAKGGSLDTEDFHNQLARRTLTSIHISLNNLVNSGVNSYAGFPGKQNLGELLKSSKDSLNSIRSNLENEYETALGEVVTQIDVVLTRRRPNNNGYYPAFTLADLTQITSEIQTSSEVFGELTPYQGPDEDTPFFFKNEDFISHLERLSTENNVQQFLDFFIMRIRSIVSDVRISSVIETQTKEEVSLESWLEDYVGKNNSSSINIIDLSLVPSEILFIVVSVLTRIIFEALQRYRKKHKKVLPTTLVIEEAHNFIKRYNSENEEISASRLCSQAFEKVAKEGRKFGLGLVVSSQRPYELSQTVLSQCNSFLLHRLVNDKDQEMVKKLVPDNMGGVLNELPILPTRKAILLGWAAPIPTLVEMNFLDEDKRPKSDDPDFWDVWTKKEERSVDWGQIASDWQNNPTEQSSENHEEEE